MSAAARRGLVVATRAVGAVLIAGGLAHYFGVARHFSKNGLPDGHRVAWDVFIGLVQLGVGALDLVAARALARGESSARWVAAVAALLVVAWGATVTPLVVGRSLPLRVAPIAYPIAHVALLAAFLRRHDGER